MNREQLFRNVTMIALTVVALVSAAQTPPKSVQQARQNTPQQSRARQTNNHKQSEGERIFAQNCARCHTPPDGFSPRISGTIVLHMRVRALLSEHDQQELLRFFNP